MVLNTVDVVRIDETGDANDFFVSWAWTGWEVGRCQLRFLFCCTVSTTGFLAIQICQRMNQMADESRRMM